MQSSWNWTSMRRCILRRQISICMTRMVYYRWRFALSFTRKLSSRDHRMCWYIVEGVMKHYTMLVPEIRLRIKKNIPDRFRPCQYSQNAYYTAFAVNALNILNDQRSILYAGFFSVWYRWRNDQELAGENKIERYMEMFYAYGRKISNTAAELEDYIAYYDCESSRRFRR